MSFDVIQEEVPSFVRRLGDHVSQGSNNTIIVLGTDRAKKGPAKIGDGLGHIKAADKGKGTGTIHIIAGRKESDPNLDKDDSFIYISMKTDVDDNLGLTSVENSQKGKPAVIVKSDCVRMVYRKDLKICLHDGKNFIFMDEKKVTVKIDKNLIEMDGSKLKAEVGSTKVLLDGNQIDLSNGSVDINATSSLVKVKSPQLKFSGGCETPWKTLFTALDAYMKGHNHHSAVGPTTPATAGVASPPLLAAFATAKTTWETQSTGG